jgi:predicted TIM-barrel fold metal-dependent hydrolase
VFIDAHTHTQPSTADKAEFDDVSEARDRSRTGTVDELLHGMAVAGVQRTMVVPWLPAQHLVDRLVATGHDRDLATATVLARWHDLNSWAAAETRRHPDRLCCLVALDPVLMSREHLAREVTEGLANGAIGLKIAPMFIKAQPDSPVMEPVWQLAREHSVFVLAEACATIGIPGYRPWGHPRHFAEVFRSYPDVPVQLAHLGMGAEDEVARLARKYPNVYADLAMRLGGPVPVTFRPVDLLQQIRAIGIDHVLFGTNYPLVDQADYVAALRGLGLSESELSRVGWENATRLYGPRAGRMTARPPAAK